VSARRVLLAAAALAALAACGRFGNTDEKADHARRIVSTSKQHTEILYALGADSDLVAVDVSSVYPPRARELPNVGYHRALSLEGMIAARPTLILSGGPGNMGPEPVVRQIEALKIPLKDFAATGTDLAGTKALFREMGAYFHRERQADSLAAKLDADMARALAAAKQEADTPRVVVIHYGQAMNVYLTILGRSVAGQMVKWAGGRMALDDTSGMRQLTSPEVIAKADPDVILLTDFGYDRLAGLADVLKLPGVATTRAARTGRIWRVEENDLVYLGPRTGENVDRLRVLIHQPGTARPPAVAATR
jgi:iron complex transport system substrate-binding protein